MGQTCENEHPSLFQVQRVLPSPFVYNKRMKNVLLSIKMLPFVYHRKAQSVPICSFVHFFEHVGLLSFKVTDTLFYKNVYNKYNMIIPHRRSVPLILSVICFPHFNFKITSCNHTFGTNVLFSVYTTRCLQQKR